MLENLEYKGRFAPSPTGPLHFGSLVAAMGSYLQAKSKQGKWLVRIDDIDPPREVAGAADNILRTLEQFGFEWDETVTYQSKRHHHYQDVVNELLRLHLAYPCSCSRSSILEQTGQTKGNIIYPGFCRTGPQHQSSQYSIRLLTEGIHIEFDDRLRGHVSTNLEQSHGDFIIQRRDRLFSYHLASGFDDAEQGITEVVRGSDLLDCTPSQLHVQQVLHLQNPTYCHLPIALSDTGQKLSKQNLAEPIRPSNAPVLLFKSLKFLGQVPPIELKNEAIEEIRNWAIQHWQLDLVPKTSQQKITGI